MYDLSKGRFSKLLRFDLIQVSDNTVLIFSFSKLIDSRLALDCGFRSMKQLGLSLLPVGRVLVHRRSPQTGPTN